FVVLALAIPGGTYVARPGGDQPQVAARYSGGMYPGGRCRAAVYPATALPPGAVVAADLFWRCVHCLRRLPVMELARMGQAQEATDPATPGYERWVVVRGEPHDPDD